MSQPTRRRSSRSRMAALVVAAFALISLGSTADAARSDVSGTIELQSDPELQSDLEARSYTSALSYGATARFDTSVSGRVAAKAYLYNNVVCVQDGTVVYQASNMDLSAGFVLVDQDGQNLVWDGGAAICYGTLVYRIDGRNPTVEFLDQTVFEVD